MKNIAAFFTLYWCIYYPTCIAFNDLPGFSSIDEIMTIIIFAFTFVAGKKKYLNNKPRKEFLWFLIIIGLYTVYSLLFGANVARGVYLDFIQEIRPFTVIYCTWILNPQFTKKQKKLMLGTMVVTLLAFIIQNPAGFIAIKGDKNAVQAEFPVLGQLAISTGMAWYLFTKESIKNKWIALLLVCTGLIAPKFKFMGEVVCFIAVIFFLRKKLNFKSVKTAIALGVLMVAVLTVTWTRFDKYYVTGMRSTELARPMTYRTAFGHIIWDYIPFGPGMGTFACNGAWKYYSPLYHKYHLDHIWGLDKGGGFICDAYYPTLAQFGIVGIVLFCIFWKRRLKAMNSIQDMKYYRIAWMVFFCLVIEQTADSSWLSGKGMGYCMLLALCLNANRNEGYTDDGRIIGRQVQEVQKVQKVQEDQKVQGVQEVQKDQEVQGVQG